MSWRRRRRANRDLTRRGLVNLFDNGQQSNSRTAIRDDDACSALMTAERQIVA